MSQRRYADGYRKLRRADAPRRVAFEVLSEVTSSGAFANIVLPKALRRIRPSPRSLSTAPCGPGGASTGRSPGT